MASPGSSPHTRGLPRAASTTEPWPGIIPAHAGFTAVDAGLRGGVRDHPRTRGVYPLQALTLLIGLGSSPHTRGLRRLGVPEPRAGRIIPAHAGFTRIRTSNPKVVGDHPRTRGVYPQTSCWWAGISGSSPHTRGLRAARCDQRKRLGIIPAHAGFTLLWVASTGKVGIIPAHAGFTLPRRSHGRHGRDHPRTRGVYPGLPRAGLLEAGSSPHTRGLQGHPGAPRRDAGIIPAHAGFATAASSRTATRTDHPRTRGVYARRRRSLISQFGSSPHTRGLHGRGSTGHS